MLLLSILLSSAVLLMFLWCYSLAMHKIWRVKFLITPSIFLSISSPNLTTFVVYYYRTVRSSVLQHHTCRKILKFILLQYLSYHRSFFEELGKKWILICAFVIINFKFFSIFSISIFSIFFSILDLIILELFSNLNDSVIFYAFYLHAPGIC